MTSPQPRPVPEIPEGGSNFRAPDQNFGQAGGVQNRGFWGLGSHQKEVWIRLIGTGMMRWLVSSCLWCSVILVTSTRALTPKGQGTIYPIILCIVLSYIGLG